MRAILPSVALAILLIAGRAGGTTGGEVQNRIDTDLRAGRPVVVHAVVALCDNRYQGIVPVPKSLGNGQDPGSNLYWGAAFGLRTYLTRKAGWALVRTDKDPSPGVLERIVLSKSVQRGGRPVPVYLVAEAWDGKEIRAATVRFLDLAAGRGEEVLAISRGGRAVSLRAGGASHLVAYIGHNGLMDFGLASTPAANPKAPPRSSMVLACASQPYFAPHLSRGGSHPLVLTTGLMAPEAYSVEAAVTAWAAARPAAQIREAAAGAYDKFQKSGLKAARRLFTGSP